jgi:hypothetical protein
MGGEAGVIFQLTGCCGSFVVCPGLEAVPGPRLDSPSISLKFLGYMCTVFRSGRFPKDLCTEGLVPHLWCY